MLQSDLDFLMSYDFQKILNQHLRLNNSLQIQLSVDWGSQKAHFRKNLLSSLQLTRELACQTRTVSISHSQDLGGYITAFGLKETTVGFDIENNSRISRPIVRRICQSDDELSEAPNLSALWCAKEASFKALREFDQPAVLNNILIFDWLQLASPICNKIHDNNSLSQFATFCFAERSKLRKLETFGLAFLFKNWCFSLAICFGDKKST